MIRNVYIHEFDTLMQISAVGLICIVSDMIVELQKEIK